LRPIGYQLATGLLWRFRLPILTTTLAAFTLWQMVRIFLLTATELGSHLLNAVVAHTSDVGDGFTIAWGYNESEGR
jgi:hypothetical protein